MARRNPRIRVLILDRQVMFAEALRAALGAQRDVDVVGVEMRDTDPSQVPFMSERRLPSVDDLDLVAGKAALVYALLGAKGQFGVKSSADQLLPPLPLQGPARRR